MKVSTGYKNYMQVWYKNRIYEPLPYGEQYYWMMVCDEAKNREEEGSDDKNRYQARK